MVGYIFLCGNRTEEECLQRRLFGTSNEAYFQQYFSRIEPDDTLFLYNEDSWTLRGPFRASSRCTPGIEPRAWRGQFPFQVRVEDAEALGRPLTADDLAGIVRLVGTHSAPPPVLSEAQIEELLRRLRLRNQEEAVTGPRETGAGHGYIFRCNRETGAECFDQNIMCAPASVLKMARNVHAGETVFLWAMDERHLYGVWRAASPGQYWPGRTFPAVVVCDRSSNLGKGIDERTLRSIVPFDGALPPYRITSQQAKRLVQALIRANAAVEPDKGRPQYGQELPTLDGHPVRSRGERIIDAWLFYHGISHAYDHLVRVNGSAMRCDFFLPNKKQYIEFWGLAGEDGYDMRREEKVAMYKEAGLHLIQILPEDLDNLDGRLVELI